MVSRSPQRVFNERQIQMKKRQKILHEQTKQLRVDKNISQIQKALQMKIVAKMQEASEQIEIDSPDNLLQNKVKASLRKRFNKKRADEQAKRIEAKEKIDEEAFEKK